MCSYREHMSSTQWQVPLRKLGIGKVNVFYGFYNSHHKCLNLVLVDRSPDEPSDVSWFRLAIRFWPRLSFRLPLWCNSNNLTLFALFFFFCKKKLRFSIQGKEKKIYGVIIRILAWFYYGFFRLLCFDTRV